MKPDRVDVTTKLIHPHRPDNNNKKIYNAHIVMNHESEAQAVARWPDGVC